MSHFRNTVEIIGDHEILTNPHNGLVVNSVVKTSGIKFYTKRTVWNFIKYVIRHTVSYFKR